MLAPGGNPFLIAAAMVEPPSSAPESRRPTPRIGLGGLAFAVAAVLLLFVAARVMFSAFMFYDDEGYVLLSLRNFADQGGLYRDVYTQYGPFPFVFYYLLHALGLPLTHTAGRLITLGAWGGTAVLCALLAGQVTRSLAARLVVLAAVFAYLWVMASEPIHPGGLIVLLTVGVAALGHHWLLHDRLRAWALFTGAVTAALLLTKINVGVFVAFAACAWLLLHHRQAAMHRWAPGVLLVASAVLPLGLMRPLLGVEWAQTFALVWACAMMAVVRAISLRTEGRADWSTLGWGLVGAATVGAAVLGVTLARGTSLAEIWQGVVLAPLRQPTTFSIPYLWLPGTRAFALLSLGLCVLACQRRRRTPAVDTAIAIARLIAAAALVFNFTRFPAISADYLVFGLAMPCLWLFAWPLAGETPVASHARAWLVLVLLGQCLHVFPVAGSQIAWGTVLVIPLAVIGAWDAAAWLVRRQHESAAAPRWRQAARAGTVAVILFAALLGKKFADVGDRFRDGEDLGLPGAEVLRLPVESTALFRLLVFNAVAHADVLFSEPGMFSLNIWSGVPTPTRANVTHWFSLLSAERQQEIIRQLAAHPRACVILHREHITYLAQRGLGPAGALHDYLATQFETAFTFDDFEFRVHRGRTIAPFMVGELLTRAADAGTAAPGENTLLKFSLLLPPARPIARIEIDAAPGAPTPKLVFDRTSARAETTALDARGTATAPARPAPWPLTLNAPGSLALYYDRTRQPRPARGATIILRDATGETVGLARLQP